MTSISKNLYIDKMDNIVNKYNNTYYSAIEMKAFVVNASNNIDSSKEINDKDPKSKITKILNLKFKCQNPKAFLKKARFQIGLQMFL